MKATALAFAGCILLAAGYLCGIKTTPRYEMNVTADGVITRLDKVTGQLHLVTNYGTHDLPEFVPNPFPVAENPQSKPQ